MLRVPQVESTFAMQKIQPKVKAIQDKYKGDQTKAQTEVARLYQEAQVPPIPPPPRPRPPPLRMHAADCTKPSISEVKSCKASACQGADAAGGLPCLLDMRKVMYCTGQRQRKLYPPTRSV